MSSSIKAKKLRKFKGDVMCRNIKPLFNFDPPATDEEVAAAALQFVRKVSGFHTPSQANEVAFNQGIVDVAAACRSLLNSLETHSAPKDRDEEAIKAKARIAKRFPTE
jgi:hypothetical protein